MTIPFALSASASASADLPLAVGPAMRARGGRVLAIATLIAAGRLTRDDIWRAADRLDDARLRPREWTWIDEGDAADLELEGPAAEARALLEGGFEGVDVVVQSSGARDKKLLVADMDSTIIG